MGSHVVASMEVSGDGSGDGVAFCRIPMVLYFVIYGRLRQYVEVLAHVIEVYSCTCVPFVQTGWAVLISYSAGGGWMWITIGFRVFHWLLRIRTESVRLSVVVVVHWSMRRTDPIRR